LRRLTAAEPPRSPTSMTDLLAPLVLFAILAPATLAAAAVPPDAMQEPRVRAPDLVGREWLNTDRPLASWKDDLAGHVVLLDFWTYCCINCMHVLPDLERLEKDFAAEPFQVIGVHSNKFEQEGEAENIRQAILRYGIRHPVVVDEDHRIWNGFAVRAWPTLMLVDAEGKVVGGVSGEGHYELLKGVIQRTLDEQREAGVLAEKPLRTTLERAPEMALRYPGKVVAHAGALFIADSSHHRVLEVDPASGAIRRAFGSGEPGLADGADDAVQFRNPQGMAVIGGALFVADTDNHALRRVDLKSGAVSTVAGNGAQARPFPEAGPGLATALNSPWDLVADGQLLHVAMAGSHQLWTFDTASGKLAELAGSGRENIVDGPAADAQLAQPSGLALVGRRLYFADSEVSAIRYLDLDAAEVGTLVGTGLFDFGDRDGASTSALLQHPLGVAAWKDSLLVADTYNNKVKRLPADGSRSESLLGTGAEGLSEDELTFWEPGGLAVDGDTLYVADTNHHRIVAVDLLTKKWRVVLGGPRR